MNIFANIKKEIVKQVNQALDRKVAIKEADLVFPPDSKMGDISLPCFGLSKELKKSPNDIAQMLLTELSSCAQELSSVESMVATGPYLNFTLDKGQLVKKIFAEIKKCPQDFGKNKVGKKKRVMIEYSNGNTHKEYHIGHLRNISYGDAVNHILAANGFDAIPVSYINDFGIHVAKTLWWLYHKENETAKNFFENFKKGGITPGEKGRFLGQMYAEATKQMELKSQAKEEVGLIMKQVETRKGEYYKLWKETRKWSIELFDQIYRELKVHFREVFYENEVIEEGFKIVADLYEKHILVKSQGAVIANLEKYNLGVLLFLRSDGTALYPVADLPLAMLKFKKYKLHKSIYVVDIRQGLYFEQLSKVMELLGYKQELMHLGYDFVKLPEGMMSSRTGNIVTYQELSEKMLTNAKTETRNKHEDWTENKIDMVAKQIAYGAMKFEMIKVSRDKTITFDIEKALRFDGYTAAYLQYTCARINSILRKDDVVETRLIASLQAKNLAEGKEHALIMKLAKYSLAVELAGQNYEPSEIAKYLFELAQQFNDYYHDVPILKAPEEIKSARLGLIKAVKQVIANGLVLLGIETIEEM